MRPTAAHLWADRYDRDLTDIFDVQDDVTHRIVDALKITLSPAEKERLADTRQRHPTSLPTTACCAAANSCSARKRTSRRFGQAIKYFKEALEHDPNYSVAYACLGFGYMFDYQNRWTEDPDGSLSIAKEYARQAIEKDPNEPLARCVSALAASYEKDLDRAQAEIDVALALNPNLALAHNLRGTFATYSGSRSKRSRRSSRRCASTRR